MKTRLNGEEGYAEIKDGGVMIFNQFTLIACWLLAQLYNCKLFVVCCLYSLSLFILSQIIKSLLTIYLFHNFLREKNSQVSPTHTTKLFGF